MLIKSVLLYDIYYDNMLKETYEQFKVQRYKPNVQNCILMNICLCMKQNNTWEKPTKTGLPKLK